MRNVDNIQWKYKGVMADIIYFTLKGNKQGLIPVGCSTYDSMGIDTNKAMQYFLIPSIISLVFWYFYVFVKFPIGSFFIWDSTFSNFKTVLIGSYLRGFTIFMTLTCIASDVIVNVFRLVIYLVKK